MGPQFSCIPPFAPPPYPSFPVSFPWLRDLVASNSLRFLMQETQTENDSFYSTGRLVR